MRYIIEHGNIVWDLALQHFFLACIPVFLCLVTIIPIALICRNTRCRKFAMMLSTFLYTIPSLALFIIIPTVINTSILSTWNIIVTLFIYSFALLLRSVPESFDTVPAPVIAAAIAVGFTPRQVFYRIQLPLAVPALVQSFRIIIVANIAMVSLGTLIGIHSLGDLFTEGFQRNYPSEIIAGIIAIIVLALIGDTTLLMCTRYLSRWKR